MSTPKAPTKKTKKPETVAEQTTAPAVAAAQAADAAASTTAKATRKKGAEPAPPPAVPEAPRREVFEFKPEGPIMTRANTAMTKGHALKVVDAVTYAAAAQVVDAGKALVTEIETYFEDDRRRAHELHQSITTKIKEATAPIKATIDRLLKECKDWRNEQERQRQIQQAKEAADEKARQDAIAQAQADELRAGGLDLAAEAVLEESRDAIAMMPSTVSVASTVPETSLGYRENWCWEVVDETKIPREYYIRDDRAISKMVGVQKGLCRIPGIRVFNDPIPVSKRRA